MPADWQVEPLQIHHDRLQFSCGEPALDNYLARLARQHQDSGISRTFVAVTRAEPGTVLGYYSLAVGALDKGDPPPAEFRHFPKFLQLPIVRLARLAIDSSQQKKGLGEDLLTDAMARCLRVAEEAGVAILVVDAKHERAKTFYLKYGFQALPDRPLTLWLLLPAIRKALRSPEPRLKISRPAAPPA